MDNNASSYTIFAEYVKGKKLTKKKIERLFMERVEHSDYMGSNKGEIIDFLVELSNEI
jgi:hypothetical protein